jgi:DNA-dependent RNA polymerase auxiliary subunit epsilon
MSRWAGYCLEEKEVPRRRKKKALYISNENNCEVNGFALLL